MNKKSRNLIIGIILILLIVVAFLIYVTLKTKNIIEQNEIQANTKVIEENKNENNVLNNTIENKIENNVENTENNIETNENKEENTKNEEKNEVQINPLLSKEEIAIELVKNDWGTTEGVYFTNMAIDSNGYYVIFVNKSGSENSSGSLKLAEYRVDSENYKIIRKKVSHNNY